MYYKWVLLALIALSAYGNVLRGNDENDIIQGEEIEDPLIISSNFTKDVYTKDRKTYCMFYEHNDNVSEAYYGDIQFTYSYFLHRDKVKDHYCLDFNILHPFVIHNKKCYVEAEYIYKNKTFTHRIEFTLHENNILCFTLTIIFSITLYPCFLVLFFWKFPVNPSDLDYCDCLFLFRFIVYSVGMVYVSGIVGLIVALVGLFIYPYSFVGIGVVIGFGYQLICKLNGNTKSTTRSDYVILDVKLKYESRHYEVEILDSEYDDLNKTNGILKIDTYPGFVEARFGYDEIRIKEFKHYYHTEDTFLIFSICCSLICCTGFLIFFFAESTLRNNMFKASRGVLLALEYHTMIVACYGVIFIIAVFIYSIYKNYKWCKDECCCCNKSSSIGVY